MSAIYHQSVEIAAIIESLRKKLSETLDTSIAMPLLVYTFNGADVGVLLHPDLPWRQAIEILTEAVNVVVGNMAVDKPERFTNN